MKLIIIIIIVVSIIIHIFKSILLVQLLCYIFDFEEFNFLHNNIVIKFCYKIKFGFKI